MIQTHGKQAARTIKTLHDALSKLCAFDVPHQLRTARDITFAALSLPDLNYDLVNLLHNLIREGVKPFKVTEPDNGYQYAQFNHGTAAASFNLLKQAQDLSTDLWVQYHPEEIYRLPDGNLQWIVSHRNSDEDAVPASAPMPKDPAPPETQIPVHVQKIMDKQKDAYKQQLRKQIRRPQVAFYLQNADVKH